MTHTTKICVGIFLGPHGVKGQLRLGSYTSDPEAIFDYKPLTDAKGLQEFALTFKGTGKDHYIVALKGCTTRENAEDLKGVKLYIDRAVLPEAEEGEYYYADLIGLTARDDQGKDVGVVEAIHDHGAGAFLEIKPPHAKSFMLPFKDAFVPVVDIEKGFLDVVIPEGWLSEEKPKSKTARKEKADE